MEVTAENVDLDASKPEATTQNGTECVPNGSPEDASDTRESEPSALAEDGKLQEISSTKKRKRVKITLPSRERVHAAANKNNNNNAAPLAKIKLARRKRKPSRYQDCFFDIPTKLMNINRTIDAEVFRACQRRTPKPAKNKSGEKKTSDQQQPSPPSGQAPVFCAESAGNAVTFDEEGNFRFKVCKEHTIRSKLGGPSYRCDICDMLFPRSFSLSRHYERLHINPRFIRNKGKKDQEIISKLPATQNGQEPTPKGTEAQPEKGPGERETKAQVSNPEPENAEAPETGDANGPNDSSFYLFACKLCTRQQLFFTKKDELRRHHQAKHGNLVRKMLNVFKCDSCERSYPTRHELLRHQRSHSGERPYACRFCAKRFPTSTNARRHERTHPCDRPHLCKVCKKSFIQKTDMVKHLRSVHKMKVTKTKAERAVRKSAQKQKATPKTQNQESPLPDAATVKSSKAESPPSKTKRATDKTNQFEENIDFAAYLKLDQFEKGSLMGGQTVVETPLSGKGPAPNAADATRRSGEVASGADTSQEVQVPNAESLGADGKPRRCHKCTECPKSFTSQVNLRRHFRLKHERNQVVRAAMPVSMVVEKFKIQDEEEAKEEEANNNQRPLQAEEDKQKTLTERAPDAKPATPKSPEQAAEAAPNCQTETGSRQAKTTKLVSAVTVALPTDTPVASSQTAESKERSVARKAGAKAQQGSKLSSILQRLSDRQDSALKTNQEGLLPHEEKPAALPPAAEAQHRASKRKLPIPTQRIDIYPEPSSQSRSILQESDLLVPLNDDIPTAQPKISITKTAHSPPWKPLRHQATGHSRRYRERIQRRQLHIHSRNAEPKMAAKKLPPPQYSLPSTLSQYFVSFSPTARHQTACADVTYTVAQPKRRQPSLSTAQQVDLGSLHGISAAPRPSTQRLQHRRQEANVMSTKVVRNGTLMGTVHHLPQPPRPKPPRPSAAVSYGDSVADINPLNLKISAKRPHDERPADDEAPLDLRHPRKKPVRDYVVTDDGVLDFSKKTRDSLVGKTSEPEPAPLALTKPSSSRNQPSSQDKQSAFYKPSKPGAQRSSNIISPQSVPQSLALPLKFHDVKFHKGRQVDGAGTAGRPISARRTGRTPRQRAYPLDPQPQQSSQRFQQSRRFHPYQMHSETNLRQAKGIQSYAQMPSTSRDRAGVRRHSDEGFVPIANTASVRNVPQAQGSLARNWHGSPRLNHTNGGQQTAKAALPGQQPPHYTNQRLAPQRTFPFATESRERLRPPSGAEGLNQRRTSLEGAKLVVSAMARPTNPRISDPKQRGSAVDLDRDVMNRCIQKAQFQLQMQSVAGARDLKGQMPALPPGYGHFEGARAQSYDNAAMAFPGRVDRIPLNPGTMNVSSLHDINDHQLLTRTETNVRHKSSDSTSDSNEVALSVLQQEPAKDSPGTKGRSSNRNQLTVTPGFDTNGEDSSRDGDDAERVASAKSSGTAATAAVASQPSSPVDRKKCQPETATAEPSQHCAETLRGDRQEVAEENTEEPKPADVNTDAVEKCKIQADADPKLDNLHGVDDSPGLDQSPEIPIAAYAEESKVVYSSPHPVAPSPSDIKETNLSTEGGPTEDDLRETNLFKLEPAGSTRVVTEDKDAVEETTKPTAAAEDCKSDRGDAAETCRKFVQKLKLRAVKSQDGASATHWTLVANGQNQENSESVEMVTEESPTSPMAEASTNHDKKSKAAVTPTRHQSRTTPRKRSRKKSTTPTKAENVKAKSPKSTPEQPKLQLESASRKPDPSPTETDGKDFESVETKEPVSGRDKAAPQEVAKPSVEIEDGVREVAEANGEMPGQEGGAEDTEDCKREPLRKVSEDSENSAEKTAHSATKDKQSVESEEEGEEEDSQCHLVVLLDRAAAHRAVSALQTEQQVRRALRHEKNVLKKSKRDVQEQEKATAEEEEEDGAPASPCVKEAALGCVELECVGNYVDVKSDDAASDGDEAVVKTGATATHSRRGSKTSKGDVEIVPVVKDHTYVKQDRKTGGVPPSNGDMNKESPRKSANSEKRKSASPGGLSRAKERRNLRARTQVATPAKAEQGKAKAGASLAKKSSAKSGSAPLPAPKSPVIIKAGFVVKMPTIGQKTPLPRKIDLSKILPPVSVHTKRSVPASSGSSHKRRSIRKYSKDFLPK